MLVEIGLVHFLQLKYFHKPEGSQRKIKMSVKSKSKLGGGEAMKDPWKHVKLLKYIKKRP